MRTLGAGVPLPATDSPLRLLVCLGFVLVSVGSAGALVFIWAWPRVGLPGFCSFGLLGFCSFDLLLGFCSFSRAARPGSVPAGALGRSLRSSAAAEGKTIVRPLSMKRARVKAALRLGRV